MAAMTQRVDVVELSPLRAVTMLWCPQQGVPVLTVICKATYDLVAGVAPLAEAQDDVNERDLHTENNPNMGLYSASDLAPFKPCADVTVVGKAFSPPRELARELVARVRVGTVDKRIEVHAARYIQRDGRISDEAFFSKMALGYERAPGGAHTANPVGVSLKDARDELGRIAVPNLQRPGESVAGPNSRLTPVGFGPIPATWPTRQELVPEELRGWLDADLSEREVPADWNWAYFNVAPKDQQLDEIRSDERIHLEHLHPEEPMLDTRLPGHRPCVFIERPDGPKRLTMKGDTLWIDTNRLVQTVTWRGQIALDWQPEAVDVLVAMDGSGKQLDWEQVQQLAEVKRRLPEPSAPSSLRAGMAPLSSRAPISVSDVPTTVAKRPAAVELAAQSGPISRMTSPVPLVPSSDHTPNWMPSPSSSGAPPPSIQSEPGSRSPIVVEVPLDEGDERKLQELCKALGYDEVEALRHALHEAYAARFK